jgi:hypothetical protein
VTLSDDQRALLRLLAQREEGYEDIAALKGLSVEQVRAEVKEALAEMQAAGETPPPLPPSPPAKAEEPAPPTPPPVEAKEAPEPAAPPPVPPPVPPVAPESLATKPASPPSRPKLPAERRRLVVLTGGALAIVAVVLAAIAIFSGGSDSNSGSTSNAASGTENTAFAESPTATNKKVTRALLSPVDGGDGEGLAVFGRLRKQVRLAIAAKGLEPAGSGQAYVVWLANASDQKVPVTLASVNDSGEIAAQYPIPAQVLLYLAEGAFDEIDISLVSTARYKAAFAKARGEKKLPAYTGSDVLRGKVVGPIVNAASKTGR